nr:retrovirus-related Pol polyprotein from transposon TNT 1-94 [Tanacetum cinerariifolium]
MATTLDQQVALDEALVPSVQRLRIGRSNLRLPSDTQSKEPTLQVECWATAKLHQHSIRFKIDTRKHVLDLEAFREMLHISPRIPGQSFDELPFEEEILEFLRLSAAAKGKQPAKATTSTEPTDVERTEAKQLKIVLKRSRQETHISQQSGSGTDKGTGSRPGVPDVPSDDSKEELSWNSFDDEDVDEQTKGREENFVYQMEHKNQKRSNEMNYPRFTKVIIDYFMTRKPSISRRNRINWHYVRDDALFSTIKVVSRHQTTQQYGAILPIELTTAEIRNSSHGTDLYSITLQDTDSPNPICLMAKVTSSQAWLWHRRLSYLNFNTINLLSKNDILVGLPKLKFIKDHLCSSCELGKAKRKSFHSKLTPSSKRRLHLLHMNLCGPMRVASINGKRYVLVIVDDYSRYTWTHFLRSKDETSEVLIEFLRLVKRGLQAQVRVVRTDKGTVFLN